jgi:hypothetical protein
MHDQAMPARVPMRARISAFLKAHPGRTAYEICLALDVRRPNGTVAGSVFQLLRDMERKGQVVAVKEFRPQQGRQVNLWHLAPAGTPAPASAPSTEGADCRHAQDRPGERRSRVRRRSLSLPAASTAWSLPSGPACAGADPDLFFPLPGQPADPAKAICAGCRVRTACLVRAHANGERYGVWGGVDLDAEAGTARPA